MLSNKFFTFQKNGKQEASVKELRQALENAEQGKGYKEQKSVWKANSGTKGLFEGKRKEGPGMFYRKKKDQEWARE